MIVCELSTEYPNPSQIKDYYEANVVVGDIMLDESGQNKLMVAAYCEGKPPRIVRTYPYDLEITSSNSDVPLADLTEWPFQGHLTDMLRNRGQID